MTRVAVVVPTRNRRALLLDVLGAVLAQRGVDLDVVVVDEGSSDGSAEAVAALGDARVRVVRHEVAQGLPAARNAGIAHVNAEWLAFCDDDDLWAPTKLAEQLAALEASDGLWSCTAAVEVDSNLSIIGWQRPPAAGIDLHAMRGRNPVPGGGSTVLVRRDAVLRLGGFDESLRAAEDWDMWWRLCSLGPPTTVDRPLVAYRVWTEGMSRDLSRIDAGAGAVVARQLDGRATRAGHHREHARYRIKLMVRNGQRLRAAAALLALARQPSGSATDALKAPLVALAPHLYLRAGAARSRRGVPASWPDEVAGWLVPMRSRSSLSAGWR